MNPVVIPTPIQRLIGDVSDERALALLGPRLTVALHWGTPNAPAHWRGRVGASGARLAPLGSYPNLHPDAERLILAAIARKFGGPQQLAAVAAVVAHIEHDSMRPDWFRCDDATVDGWKVTADGTTRYWIVSGHQVTERRTRGRPETGVMRSQVHLPADIAEFLREQARAGESTPAVIRRLLREAMTAAPARERWRAPA